MTTSKRAKKAAAPAKFYLNADRLRARGACPSSIRELEEVLGPGNWPVNDATYKKLKRAGLEWRIYWVAFRYLTHKEQLKAAVAERNDRRDYRTRLWDAIKRKMAKDKKRRPAHWYNSASL